MRRHTWSNELEDTILQLRERHVGWGKDKLVVLARRQGVRVSTSMVGRIITQLKSSGRLYEAPRRDPCSSRRRVRRPHATRKLRDYRATAPVSARRYLSPRALPEA